MAVSSTPTRRDRRRVATQQKRDRIGAELLEKWKREADRRSRSLTADAVWALLDENAAEATRAGVLAELRDICFVAAANFANPRMARIVRCHRKGREVPDHDTDGGTPSDAERTYSTRDAETRRSRA